MLQLLWFAIAWVAGVAAILGGLMTVGSLILWAVPETQPRSRKPDTSSLSVTPSWQQRLKVLLFSSTLAVVGLGILIIVPFPSV